MKRITYKTVYVHFWDSDKDKIVNQYLQEGWKIVSYYREPHYPTSLLSLVKEEYVPSRYVRK